jgi:hypothetical protein
MRSSPYSGCRTFEAGELQPCGNIGMEKTKNSSTPAARFAGVEEAIGDTSSAFAAIGAANLSSRFEPAFEPGCEADVRELQQVLSYCIPKPILSSRRDPQKSGDRSGDIAQNSKGHANSGIALALDL